MTGNTEANCCETPARAVGYTYQQISSVKQDRTHAP